MIDPDDTSSGDASQAVLSAEEKPSKYCNQCGAEWMAGWTSCPRCRLQRLPEEREHSISASLGLYFTLLGISIGGIVAIGAGAPRVETQFILTASLAVVVVGWCFAARKMVFPVLIARVDVKWFVVAVVLATGTFTSAAAFLTFLHRAIGLPLLQYAAPILHADYGWMAVILSIAVMPAIFEELAFRGIILTSLSHVMGSTEAGLVSAFMFMVVHLSVPNFPSLLLIGLALAYLRVKSGSLLPGMLLHFTHNLLCVLAERQVGPHFFT